MVPQYDWHQAHKDDKKWKTETEDDMTGFEDPLTSDDSNAIMPTPTVAEATRGSRTGTRSIPPQILSHMSTATETTIATSPYNPKQSAAPEHTGSSATPTPINSSGETSPTSTGSGGFGDDPFDSEREQQSPNHVPMYAAAGIVPVVVLTILGAVIFFCLKKQKKQRKIAAAQAKVQEMKSRPVGNQPTIQAYMATPIPPPRQPSYTNPPSHPPPASPTPPQPVIIGPISAGSSGNYMTGIDTSDIISVRNERTGLGDPFADGNSLHEEPPPPYRPRSIAPLSRDTSLRVAQQPAATSQTNLITGRGEQQPLRSPFDDPSDDDAVSELSGPTLRRNRDDMSVVSDLLYQQDPIVGRSGL